MYTTPLGSFSGLARNEIDTVHSGTGLKKGRDASYMKLYLTILYPTLDRLGLERKANTSFKFEVPL